MTDKVSARTKQKEESRIKILKAAAALFKQNGFSATGVDALMERAGLTAGAFYAHFDSKSDLLAEALKYSFDRGFGLLTIGLEKAPPQERVETLMKRYLSCQHRDAPEKGCAIVGMAAELARQDQKIQKVVADYVEKLSDYIAENLVDVPAKERKARALSMVSAAVGALLLSRLTKNSTLSENLLNATSRSLI